MPDYEITTVEVPGDERDYRLWAMECEVEWFEGRIDTLSPRHCRDMKVLADRMLAMAQKREAA